MRIFVFYIVLKPLGKVRIQVINLQLWVISRTDWALWSWYGNQSWRKKTLHLNLLNLALKTDFVLHLARMEVLLYIYIYCHPQTDCFVVTQLFSVARHVRRFKLRLKPTQLYVRLSILPLSHRRHTSAWEL